MQSVNNQALIVELDKLLERLRVPPEVSIPLLGELDACLNLKILLNLVFILIFHWCSIQRV